MPRLAFWAHSSPDLGMAPHQPLSEHLMNTGELAARFAMHFGTPEMARAIGLLHDLGKYSQPFQRRVLGQGGRVDHSTWGAKMALARYAQLGWLLAYGIAGHHAGLANGKSFDGARMALAARLADAQLPALDTAWESEITLPALPGLAAECARLRPDPQLGAGFSLSFLVRMLFSALVDADYQDTERYYDTFVPDAQRKAAARQQAAPSLQALRDQLNVYLGGFKADTEVNRLRAEMPDAGPGAPAPERRIAVPHRLHQLDQGWGRHLAACGAAR